jgi:hypothetical protein
MFAIAGERIAVAPLVEHVGAPFALSRFPSKRSRFAQQSNHFADSLLSSLKGYSKQAKAK